MIVARRALNLALSKVEGFKNELKEAKKAGQQSRVASLRVALRAARKVALERNKHYRAMKRKARKEG